MVSTWEERGGARLGILELCKRGPGSAKDDAHDLLELARGAERLGYERFWLAEHHVADSCVTVPDVLIGAILASTDRIRGGLGGVILRYRSPYRVAELARSLATLGGGRVDLGMCRGPGLVDASVATELVNGNEWELTEGAFEHKVLKALRMMRGEGCPPVWPTGTPACEPWLLGSSIRTATTAARHGASLALSLFICQDEAIVAQAIRTYRSGIGGPPPGHGRVAVATSVVAAGTHDAAVRRHDELVAGGALASNMVGSYDACLVGLAALADRVGADDLLLVSFSRDSAERADLHAALAPPGWSGRGPTLAPQCGPKASVAPSER